MTAVAQLETDRTWIEGYLARRAAQRVNLTGVELIARERSRQVADEGWSAEHDHAHTDGSLATVAALYALPKSNRTVYTGRFTVYPVQLLWPKSWNGSWWKPCPEDRVRELVKAGALIAAEIDRLQAAAR